MRVFLQRVVSYIKGEKRFAHVNINKELALLVAEIRVYKKAMQDCKCGIEVLSIQDKREAAINDLLDVIEKYGITLNDGPNTPNNVIRLDLIPKSKAS